MSRDSGSPGDVGRRPPSVPGGFFPSVISRTAYLRRTAGPADGPGRPPVGGGVPRFEGHTLNTEGHYAASETLSWLVVPLAR